MLGVVPQDGRKSAKNLMRDWPCADTVTACFLLWLARADTLKLAYKVRQVRQLSDPSKAKPLLPAFPHSTSRNSSG
jgi:hypothetical protein